MAQVTLRKVVKKYDEVLADSFPYQAAYLPVNRLLDGSMHDW